MITNQPPAKFSPVNGLSPGARIDPIGFAADPENLREGEHVGGVPRHDRRHHAIWHSRIRCALSGVLVRRDSLALDVFQNALDAGLATDAALLDAPVVGASFDRVLFSSQGSAEAEKQRNPEAVRWPTYVPHTHAS